MRDGATFGGAEGVVVIGAIQLTIFERVAREEWGARFVIMHNSIISSQGCYFGISRRTKYRRSVH